MFATRSDNFNNDLFCNLDESSLWSEVSGEKCDILAEIETLLEAEQSSKTRSSQSSDVLSEAKSLWTRHTDIKDSALKLLKELHMEPQPVLLSADARKSPPASQTSLPLSSLANVFPTAVSAREQLRGNMRNRLKRQWPVALSRAPRDFERSGRKSRFELSSVVSVLDTKTKRQPVLHVSPEDEILEEKRRKVSTSSSAPEQVSSLFEDMLMTEIRAEEAQLPSVLPADLFGGISFFVK